MTNPLQLILCLVIYLSAVGLARECSDKKQITVADKGPAVFVDEMKIKTNRPIIGVLTQETDGNLTMFGQQYMIATYVKFLESAGARVAPIFVNSSMEELEKMFQSINGVVLPGGHAKLNESRFTIVGKKIFELALEANSEGDVFPVWGECMGFELLTMLISGQDLSKGQYDESFFGLTDAENISLSLQLPPDYKETTLMGSAPSYIVRHLTTTNSSYNNHVRGLFPKVFAKDEKLKRFFRIVSTAKDRKGVEFVSTLEGRNQPVFLFQWHPTKFIFEWSTEMDYVHTQTNVQSGQYFASLFVNQARLSSHRFPSEKEEKSTLIYRYTPRYTGDVMSMLQTYFW